LLGNLNIKYDLQLGATTNDLFYPDTVHTNNSTSSEYGASFVSGPSYGYLHNVDAVATKELAVTGTADANHRSGACQAKAFTMAYYLLAGASPLLAAWIGQISGGGLPPAQVDIPIGVPLYAPFGDNPHTALSGASSFDAMTIRKVKRKQSV
jgi:hypothetical protein